MASRILLSAAFLAALTGAAVAAPVTVGSYTFDSSAYADISSKHLGTIGNAGGMSNNDLSMFAVMGAGSVIRFEFIDNGLVNGIGDDILVFETSTSTNSSVSISASGNGGFISGHLRESVLGSELLGSSYSSYHVNIFGFDLTELSVAANASFSSPLYLMASSGVLGSSAGISQAVAYNSTISAVPLPAALPLLSVSIAGLGFIGWLRQRWARS